MVDGAPAARDRHIALEGSSNLRDVGGYRTADGRQVRWDLIYRSGALARLSEADWAWMRARDIGTVCDLRSHEERALAPTAWSEGERPRHASVAYSAELIFGKDARPAETVRIGEMNRSLYNVFPRLLAPSLRMMFDALVDGHVPLIVHCSAGQDRTGLAIGLILTALGVPRETVFEDYLLSTALRRPHNELDRAALAESEAANVVAQFYMNLQRKHGERAFEPRSLIDARGAPLLAAAFAVIEAEWGTIAAYLDRELGLDAARTAALRAACLEPAGAPGAPGHEDRARP